MRPEFDSLYAAHAPYVLNVTRRIVGADDAADVAQETWLKVSRGLDRFREDAQPRSWLTAIAQNASRDHLRRARNRKHRHIRVDLECAAHVAAPGGDGHDRYLQRERDAELDRGVGALPPRLRAVVLAYRLGLTFPEAATALGGALSRTAGARRSANKDASQTRRARRDLRTLFNHPGNDTPSERHGKTSWKNFSVKSFPRFW